MVPLEINASGRPVIAYGAGGATETVIDGATGIFFKEQTVESLVSAIEEFESCRWNRQLMRHHAEKFDTKVFTTRVRDFLHKVAPASCVQEILETRKHKAFGVQEAQAV